MTQTVRYPIGEQSFREIIRNGYVYVDKTMYIHKLVNENKYYFLSRPRRFGKSLLVTTMEQYFKEGIEKMGRHNGWSYDETVQELKKHYDGYHFAGDLNDVYNPYSLLNALQVSNLGSYWYATGTPTRLYEELNKWDFPLEDLEGIRVAPRTLETGDVLGNNLEVLFYYTGYLTIKQQVKTNSGERYVLGYLC